jgi:ectoine hydroxylase-related dioxygenase (phytanoyl-CoA dioxygenase family)
MDGGWKRLFGRGRPADGLTAAGLLASDLWLDQPDALRQIERRQKRGEIDDAQATALASFAERGFLTLPLMPPPDAAGIEACVEELWQRRPADVAYAYRSPLRRLSTADPVAHRRPSCRIADLHAVCAPARDLFLHPQLFTMVELILGQPAVAVQSLYFEFGSQQPLHRDPVHVYTTPASHLLASWVALEDIRPGSGELVYVPGSHQLPYYQFSPGDHRFDHGRHSDADALAAQEFELAQCSAAGLQVESFLPRRGEALIWHASLLHGGGELRDETLTRKSFVVHYSSAANYPRVKRAVEEPVPGADGAPVMRSRIHETEELLVEGSRRGFASPLRPTRT